MAMTVNAGPDQTIPVREVARISASISGAVGTARHFWRKITGPGEARFSHNAFYSGFEDGTFSEWLAKDQFGFEKGNYNGAPFVTTTRAYSGRRSWQGQNDSKLDPPYSYSAKLLRWVFDGFTGMYGHAWYWIPPGYDVAPGPDNWVLIQQFKERISPFDPTMTTMLHHDGVSGFDHVQLWDATAQAAYNNTAAEARHPLGQWFHVCMYCKLHLTTGIISIWLNGVQIYHLTGQNTLGQSGNTSLMWGIGNYSPNVASVNNPIWVDDATVVNEAANQLTTTVTFSEPGTYTMRLTASDDAETVSDDIVFTVTADPYRRNTRSRIRGR